MKIIKIEQDKLTFDNGNILSSHHNQDCCENVYADFEGMQIMTMTTIDTNDLVFDEDLLSNINLIEGVGFELVDKNGIRILTSCYNSQNGYYSSNLELIYNRDKIRSIIDITNYVKDDIN